MRKCGVIITLVIVFTTIGCIDKTNSKMSYKERRYKALYLTPEELGLSLPQDSTVVYGVAMDWMFTGGQGITTTAYSNGKAETFGSNGEYVTENKRTEIQKDTQEFILAATKYIDGVPAIKTPMPADNYIGFFILTNKGIYAHYEEGINFKHGKSPLTNLLDTGNKLYLHLKGKKYIKTK